MQEDNRADLIAGLRQLAQFLEDNRNVPAPTDVRPFVMLGYGHSFVDVLDIAEKLAPCTIEDSHLGVERRELTRAFGNGAVKYRVLVDAAAVGETRTVTRSVPEFIVDAELLRIAAEGPHRRVATPTLSEQQTAAQARPTTAAQQAEAATATSEAVSAA